MQRVFSNGSCSQSAEPPEFGDVYPASRQFRPLNRYVAASLLLIAAGCSIAPPAIQPPEEAGRGVRFPGPVLYRVRCTGPALTSLAREDAEAEASRIAGGFLETIFEQASPAPASVREAATLYPEKVRKDYAPLAILLFDVEEVSATLSWGYQVRATLRLHNLRPWVDRHWTGVWDPREERVPPMHLEDHGLGWAKRSLFHRRADADHLFGEALTGALRGIGSSLAGNPWLHDFYRLPGPRDPLGSGPGLSTVSGRRGP